MLKNGKTEVYNIPLDDRIYVMEDVDCENDILLDRKFKKKETEKKSESNDFSDYEKSFEYRYEPFVNTNFSSFEENNESKKKQQLYKNIEEDTSEQITLSHILNILDGILETPGRI